VYFFSPWKLLNTITHLSGWLGLGEGDAKEPGSSYKSKNILMLTPGEIPLRPNQPTHRYKNKPWNKSPVHKRAFEFSCLYADYMTIVSVEAASCELMKQELLRSHFRTHQQ